ncbi:hypothetical protein [Pantoea stewartii]|uniref:hypothetical protein n=1 Tax=Pantoea stewartii TaxID=66269 RepID=UPI00138FB053|nr:hypothetical protein [Pantoea stewartii]
MKINKEDGSLDFENGLIISSTSTKKNLFAMGGLFWEGWPDNGDDTVNYRAFFNTKNNRQGDIYLIVFLSHNGDENATVVSWCFAPDNLLMGEQNKPEGKVTRKLREWFKVQSGCNLPVYGAWGHIDAAYDPHNRTGMITCNYRSGFEDANSWSNYCEWNKLKF